MNLKTYIPGGPDIVREAIIVMAGALLAVLIVKQLPSTWQQMFNINSFGEPQK